MGIGRGSVGRGKTCVGKGRTIVGCVAGGRLVAVGAGGLVAGSAVGVTIVLGGLVGNGEEIGNTVAISSCPLQLESA